MFFQKLSFRVQNIYSDKIQSFIPESRIVGKEMLPQMLCWILLKFLPAAENDNRAPN